MSTLLSVLLASAVSATAPITGGDVIKAMYAKYPFETASIVADESKARGQFLDAELIALLDADEACSIREQGICNIDADPIYHAQDAEITELKVAAGKTPSEWIVTFKNFGELQTLVYTMSDTPAGPRVHDIDYGQGETLRGWLSTPVP